MNHELPDLQVGFRKGRRTRDQIANICGILEEVREFQKNIYFCFIDYTKAFDYVDHNKLWKILKEMEISDHLTGLLRNLYACQKAIEVQKTSISALLTMPKPLTVWITINCGKF